MCDGDACSEVGFCPKEVVKWSSRRTRILNEIARLDADLLCLQEVERVIFEEDLEPWFLENGYEGVYFCKKPQVEEGFEEGVALMYKRSSFVRVFSVCAPFRDYLEIAGQGKPLPLSTAFRWERVLCAGMFFRRLRSLRDGFALALLHHVPSKKEVLVGGVDLYEHESWPDARVAQIHVLCETMYSVLKRQSRPRETPAVVLGDFASYWKKWTTDINDKVRSRSHSLRFCEMVISSG